MGFSNLSVLYSTLGYARLGILTGNKMKIRENKWSEQKAGKKIRPTDIISWAGLKKKYNENLV